MVHDLQLDQNTTNWDVNSKIEKILGSKVCCLKNPPTILWRLNVFVRCKVLIKINFSSISITGLRIIQIWKLKDVEGKDISGMTRSEVSGLLLPHRTITEGNKRWYRICVISLHLLMFLLDLFIRRDRLIYFIVTIESFVIVIRNTIWLKGNEQSPWSFYSHYFNIYSYESLCKSLSDLWKESEYF